MHPRFVDGFRARNSIYIYIYYRLEFRIRLASRISEITGNLTINGGFRFLKIFA